MIETILKRYPTLNAEDIALRDDMNGKGPYISFWNSVEPKPAMEEVIAWHEEDMANYVPPLTPEQELQSLKKQQVLMQAALDDLIFSGGML